MQRRTTIELTNPTYHYSYNNLAWLRATCADVRLRNGTEAVEFAKKACELTQWGIPEYIATLAAAYAENGDFDQAVNWQQKTIDATKDDAFRKRMQERLVLYQQRKPY